MLPSDLHGSTTETVGFFQLPAQDLADALHRAFGDSWVRVGPFDVDLDHIADALAVEPGFLERYALVDIGESWCALFTSGPLGTDVGVLPSWTARTLDAVGIRATVVADDRSRKREGGTVLEVYDPAMVDVDGGACRRTLAAVNDGGRWTVTETGEPFDFEEPDTGLDGELLRRYLAALGVPEWDGETRPVIYLDRV